MVGLTDEFFEEFTRRASRRLRARDFGTIRLDASADGRTDHWYLTVTNGTVTVSRDERSADCVMRADRKFFEALLTGRTNLDAAVLRRRYTIEGDPTKLYLLERMLPDPPGARDPRGLAPTAAAVPEYPADRFQRRTTVREDNKRRRHRQFGVLDGNTFAVSDGHGDIVPSPDYLTGLYSFDTRFLSVWRLTVDGERLHSLSVDNLQYYQVRFFLVPGEPTQYVNAKVTVIRDRSLGGSLQERVTVLNHDAKPVRLRVRMEIESDFADLFEATGVPAKPGRTTAEVADGQLRLRYDRETFTRATIVSSSVPATIDQRGMTFDIQVEPHGAWATDLQVEAVVTGAHGRDIRESLRSYANRTQKQMRQQLDEWLAGAPRLLADSRPLTVTYQRSLVDLAALRYRTLLFWEPVPVAGSPWFMTLFGRDSILTCLQALPFKPELAAPTLRVLATNQSTKLDDFRERDPGKIMQEIRYGELAAFEEEPYAVYYGAADTTSLFVVLLDEYERWSGDVELVKGLEENVRAALDWIDTYADLRGDGYVWYQRRNTRHGSPNQCWKVSWDAISYRDGRLPGFPRATCELQGYAYDAKIRAARLAREFWGDPEYADRLERDAAELKERFNRDFWVANGEYYALALDADGSQVDALASNIGHLLWSGIVDESRAARVAELLMSPRLFSGWGVRTLATDQTRFNPVGYHVGTVWPFDNSFIAWGLRRYGFHEEAARISRAMIDAAEHFGGRLPEAFAGYDRALTKDPVPYPTACSPQAWSAGAPLLLLRTMLGLQPLGEHLMIDPALPEGLGRIELMDIPGRWGRIDALGRSRASVDEQRPVA
ncbi:SCP2 sterol-binding domain-containing protein [Micromonospora sp. DR5-3]|uniref:glycogen debranching N-terminal domain-containing protein n=1 Tax=unclassified Micromonospora TaxID=2617518 RepID=UPI001651BF01|nr:MULTISPECIES: glycogen debranching N-terminal domain-containing protein [unclassified Micromonospora]MCW3819396.1 SCP2 sterol-binding domain-containing protein [Micromonospora sp. DR5-3]